MKIKAACTRIGGVVVLSSLIGMSGLKADISSPSSTSAVTAHVLGQSYLFLRIHDDSLVVRLEVTVSDLERALGFGWDPEIGVTEEEVNWQLATIREYVEEGFGLSGGADRPFPMRFQDVDIRFLEVADFVLLTYVIEPVGRTVEELSIAFPLLFEVLPDHRNLLIVEHNWRTGTMNSEVVALVFSPTSTVQRLDITRSSVLRGFLAFIRLGIEHIWIGIDHVLFLIALTLPTVLVRASGRWEPAPGFRRAFFNIVTIVTFFTLAHSVTLSLAALELVRLPARPVEAIIALSIAVAALANLAPKIPIKEAAIAFAYVLADIGLGREHLVLSLLGFNVGVEIGQIAIISIAFPILFVLREKAIYPPILRYGSVALIAVAMLWFFERSLDFNVPVITLARRMLGLG